MIYNITFYGVFYCARQLYNSHNRCLVILVLLLLQPSFSFILFSTTLFIYFSVRLSIFLQYKISKNFNSHLFSEFLITDKFRSHKQSHIPCIHPIYKIAILDFVKPIFYYNSLLICLEKKKNNKNKESQRKALIMVTRKIKNIEQNNSYCIFKICVMGYINIDHIILEF